MGTVDPMYYSVQAVGKVVALEITKTDMTSKLPSVLVKSLEAGCHKRREFFRDRLLENRSVIFELNRQSEQREIFDTEEDRRAYSSMKQAYI